MSENVYKKGVLKPTGKTLDEYIGDDFTGSYEAKLEIFQDEYYESAVIHNGFVYEVETKSSDPYQDIFNASKGDNGVLNFEVMYYNGSCGFDEAISIALKKLSKSE